MSMQEYEMRGYGIGFRGNDSIETTVEKIEEMLKLAPVLNGEIKEWFLEIGVEEPTVEDYSDFEQDKYCGIPAIIAMAMNEKYEAEFVEYDADDDGTVYIYIPCLLPWQMTNFEKNLTEEKASDLFREFYNILYNKETSIGDVSIRQFG